MDALSLLVTLSVPLVAPSVAPLVLATLAGGDVALAVGTEVGVLEPDKKVSTSEVTTENNDPAKEVTTPAPLVASVIASPPTEERIVSA